MSEEKAYTKQQQIEALDIMQKFLDYVNANNNDYPYRLMDNFNNNNEYFGQFGKQRAGFTTTLQALKSIKADEVLKLLKQGAKDIEQLNKNKKTLQEQINNLEIQHTNLVEMIGSYEDKDGNRITLAKEVISALKQHLDDLRQQRDELNKEIAQLAEKKEQDKQQVEQQIEQLNSDYQKREERLKANLVQEQENYKKQISKAEEDANKRVKLIKQFADFLSETNNNMKLYHWLSIGLVVLLIGLVWIVTPYIANTLKEYLDFIKPFEKGNDVWWIIANAAGVLLVKIPLALIVVFVIEGFYHLIKAIVTTYEKINQDKRNLSAIYAISDNVTKGLNEKGLELLTGDTPDENQLDEARERAKWNQIANYFAGMQQVQQASDKMSKEDKKEKKFIYRLLNRLVDKIHL